MYKLLLVDDEERVRQGMRISLDWEAQRIVIVGEAEDGLEALDLIERNQPDLIISDVRMPHMNGLELTEQALRIVPHVKVILLSGYDDFAYVQQAIRNGAFDYMLKPTKVEELVSVLDKAKESIEQDIGRMRDVEQLQRELFRSRPALKENGLRQLLGGRMNAQEIRRMCGGLELSLNDGCCACLVMEIDEEEAGGEGGRTNDKRLLLFALRNISEELLRQHLYAEAIEQTDNQLVIIVSSEHSPEFGEQEEKLRVIIPNIQYNMLNYYKTTVSVGIGRWYSGSERLARSYAESLEALQYRLYSGRGSMLFVGDIGNDTTRKSVPYPYGLEEKLSLALRLGDSQGARDSARQFIHRMTAVHAVNPDRLREVCLQLALGIRRKLAEWDISDDRMPGLAKLDERMRRLQTVGQLENWLLDDVERLLDMTGDARRHRDVSMIQKAISFMEEQYHRDISLQDIADAVHLTPNYFANLFKEHAGETVFGYLTRIRMDQAKRLLLQTGLKSYEIALRVGYSDANYFGKAFKKQFGLTPVEYRKLASP